ncbi:hypothetical protein BH20ACT23_BH20ACT23_09440 [soil metagenome]
MARSVPPGRLVRALEDLGPTLSTVARAVNASVVGRIEQIARHRDEDRVRVLGVDHDAADPAAFFETGLPPALSPVPRGVEPGSAKGHRAAARVGLSRTRVQPSLRRYRKSTDGLGQPAGPRLLEGVAGIGGAPHAATRGSDIDRVLPPRVDRHIGYSASDVGRTLELPRPAGDPGACFSVDALTASAGPGPARTRSRARSDLRCATT